MLSRRRSALLLALPLAAAAALAHAQAEDAGSSQRADRVYRYRGQGGRDVFTNRTVAIAGETPRAMVLPELANLDFAAASASQLAQLDRSVMRAYDELQSGERCAAIRASLRVPMSSFVWREHLREIAATAALLALAVIMLATWGGRLRALMPIAPLLGCVYLSYATFARIERQLGALRQGLRACSTELPTLDGNDPLAVKQRLETAVSLQATIDHAYAQRAALSERIMRER